ncbi:MAG: DUF2800 domain-containing protein [Thomasclavelia ramosa]|nr:DUF2800 domain-containing protein [Thomasclavelia ramosa]
MDKTVDHSQRDHALLSASGASRWLKCPPSARLEDELPDTTSEFAKEGTVAHEVCEILLRKHLGLIAKATATKNINKLKKDKLFDAEMLGHANDYIDYITEKVKSDDAAVLVEEQLDFSKFVPEGFGTGDCIIVQDGVLTIIDFKYGKGVSVSAEDNPQMKLYALGAVEMFGFIYEFDKVEMCIFQPRINNISESVETVEELIRWGNGVIIPAAKLAFEGKGQFCAGDHCRFCKLRNKCKCLADYCLETVKKDEFEDPDGKLDKSLLAPEDIAMIIGRMKAVQNWLKDVESYAINGVLDGTLEVPGYKVVEGRSNRAYTDQGKVVTALTANGYPESVLFEKKLLSITAMEKVVGKKNFNTLLADLIEKPKGKPTIVPLSDKREPYSIANEFEIEEN